MMMNFGVSRPHSELFYPNNIGTFSCDLETVGLVRAMGCSRSGNPLMNLGMTIFAGFLVRSFLLAQRVKKLWIETTPRTAFSHLLTWDAATCGFLSSPEQNEVLSGPILMVAITTLRITKFPSIRPQPRLSSVWKPTIA